MKTEITLKWPDCLGDKYSKKWEEELPSPELYL